MMTPYSKLNSQGNDFIIVEKHLMKAELSQDVIKAYCSRDNIGCDQFFIIDTFDKANIHCEVYNQDGSKACQCGNGLRATMLYLNKKYQLDNVNIIICNKLYKTKIIKDLISVNMGSPTYLQCPDNHIDELRLSKDGLTINVELKNKLKFSFMPLSIGNEHSIVFSEKCLENKDIISKTIKTIFGYEMNIGFIDNVDDFMNNKNAIIKLTVNERGAGYTASCGSGATAAAMCLCKLYQIHNNRNIVDNKIIIQQRGGILEVIKNSDSDTYQLLGPSLFEGDGYLE